MCWESGLARTPLIDTGEVLFVPRAVRNLVGDWRARGGELLTVFTSKSRSVWVRDTATTSQPAAANANETSKPMPLCMVVSRKGGTGISHVGEGGGRGGVRGPDAPLPAPVTMHRFPEKSKVTDITDEA
jgi:hypothetical protein